MRILKSIGLVIVAGLLTLLLTKTPLQVSIGFLGLILACSIFCWGYFVLFNPNR